MSVLEGVRGDGDHIPRASPLQGPDRIGEPDRSQWPRTSAGNGAKSCSRGSLARCHLTRMESLVMLQQRWESESRRMGITGQAPPLNGGWTSCSRSWISLL